MNNRTGTTDGGAAAVLIAASLLVLMGLASLAIDGGLAFNQRRGTQNSADLAALAAAWEDCNPESGGSGPASAAFATATDNGHAHGLDGVSVSVTSPSAGTWQVTITDDEATTFGRATPFAPDDITVVSEATARCEDVGVLGGYAVFGQSSSCSGWDVSTTGSTITINGAVHTNGGLQIPKPGSSISGDVTWRDDPPVLGAGISGSLYPGSALPYPAPLDTISTSEYAPGGSRAVAALAQGSEYYHPFTGAVDRIAIRNVPGNSEAGSLLTIGAPGIYYTSGSFNLGNRDIRLTGLAASRGVTFVARGSIDMRGFADAKGFDPLVPGGTLPVFLYADGDGSVSCSAQDIKIATNSATWSGLMFAPNGTVAISGSTVGSLNGSVIAYNVNVSASSFSLTYQDDSTADPAYRVELID